MIDLFGFKIYVFLLDSSSFSLLKVNSRSLLFLSKERIELGFFEVYRGYD